MQFVAYLESSLSFTDHVDCSVLADLAAVSTWAVDISA